MRSHRFNLKSLSLTLFCKEFKFLSDRVKKASSAKRMVSNELAVRRSFIYIRNSKGPKDEPWGRINRAAWRRMKPQKAAEKTSNTAKVT